VSDAQTNAEFCSGFGCLVDVSSQVSRTAHCSFSAEAGRETTQIQSWWPLSMVIVLVAWEAMRIDVALKEERFLGYC
jgi:hypothetical protein